MSIKTKNALVHRLLLELQGHHLLTVIGCNWTQQSLATGLLYLTDQKLGFFPKKESQQSTAFPTDRLSGYDFKDGKLTATLTMYFAGLPPVEMSSILDEEVGTFLRWLDRFVNKDAARQFGTEQVYGAGTVGDTWATAAPPNPSAGGAGFPTYPGAPYGGPPAGPPQTSQQPGTPWR